MITHSARRPHEESYNPGLRHDRDDGAKTAGVACPRGERGRRCALARPAGFDENPTRTTSVVARTGASNLDAYLQDSRRVPRTVARRRARAGAAPTRARSAEPARKLITANLRLVVKIAHEYRRAHRNLLDLVQEGNIGLIQAVQQLRPVSRRQAVDLRGMVDPRLHPEVHPEQLAPGQDRYDAGAAAAVLQPPQERERLERMGFETDSRQLAERSTSPSARSSRWSAGWRPRSCPWTRPLARSRRPTTARAHAGRPGACRGEHAARSTGRGV